MLFTAQQWKIIGLHAAKLIIGHAISKQGVKQITSIEVTPLKVFGSELKKIIQKRSSSVLD